MLSLFGILYSEFSSLPVMRQPKSELTLMINVLFEEV
jgi:hypothetical protein